MFEGESVCIGDLEFFFTLDKNADGEWELSDFELEGCEINPEDWTYKGQKLYNVLYDLAADNIERCQAILEEDEEEEDDE